MDKIAIKNTSIYFFSTFVSALLPLITIPVFTRFLTVEQFGIYAIIQVYSIFLNGIANVGLTTAFEREFFEYNKNEDRAKLFFTVISFVILLQILLGFLTFVFRNEISIGFFDSEIYENLILFSFIATAFNSLKLYFLIFFKNNENAKSYAQYHILEIFFTYTFSVILIVFYDLEIIALIFGQLISNFFIFIILLFKFLKEQTFALDINFLFSSLKISFPLTPKIFFGIINSQFDKYMIGVINTMGGVGIYNVGHKIANVSFLFMTALQQTYAPQVYKRMFDMDQKSGGESIGKYLTPFMYLSIFCCLFISLFSEEIIFIMTPLEYHGASKIVVLLSLLYGTYFFGKQPQLIYSKKTWISSALVLLSIVLNILINIPFIYKWGALGAAYGTLLGGLISGIISFFVFQKFFYINWEFKKTIYIYSSFFVFSLITIILFDLELEYFLRFILKILFLLIYIILGLRINIFSIASIKKLLLKLKSNKL